MAQSGNKAEAEQAAENLLRRYCVASPPVPIEDIAHAEGATIVRHRFEGSESGFALRDNGRWIIGINTSTSPRRQRFSIAHELGHLLLHEGKPLFVDHSVLISKRDELSSLGTDVQEIEANRFAAAILMPRDLVISKLREELELATTDSRDELIARVARAFMVSTEAMGYRLINLSIISA